MLNLEVALFTNTQSFNVKPRKSLMYINRVGFHSPKYLFTYNGEPSIQLLGRVYTSLIMNVYRVPSIAAAVEFLQSLCDLYSSSTEKCSLGSSLSVSVSGLILKSSVLKNRTPIWAEFSPALIISVSKSISNPIPSFMVVLALSTTTLTGLSYSLTSPINLTVPLKRTWVNSCSKPTKEKAVDVE